MTNILLILSVCFIGAGLLPFFRWLKCKIRKHHWRVCEISTITLVVNTRVLPLDLVQQQSMLVSFRFNGDMHSVVVDLDEPLFNLYKQGQSCTLLVDKDNPSRVYKNALLWQNFGSIWLFAGLALLGLSHFIN